MQLTSTSRTLRDVDPSTTPPCWDTQGSSPTSHRQNHSKSHYEERVEILIILYPAEKYDEALLHFVFQASVFILEKGSQSKCCRHRRENAPDNSGGGGQRRHRHTVRVLLIIHNICVIIVFFSLWESFQELHIVKHNTAVNYHLHATLVTPVKLIMVNSAQFLQKVKLELFTACNCQ